MDRKKIKASAKEFAFSHKWAIWKPILVIMAVSFVVSFVVTILGIEQDSAVYNVIFTALEVALIPASIGYIYYIRELLKGNEMNVKEALLSKYSMFGLIFVVTLLVGIFTSLWSLLLVVPGLIYAFKMAMVSYIMSEDGADKMTAKEVREKSKEMMDGYKWNYFVFGLSFIGWFLLGFLTFGILYIWIVPYVTVANYKYYEELKEVKGLKVETESKPKTTKKTTKKEA